MPGQIAIQSPVQIFVQKKTHLGGGECVLPRFFQQSDDLLALHARKTLQELFDRIARLQVIKKTLHRHTRPDKNRLTAEDFRILRYHLAHNSEHS